jgi:predicted secreted protein
MSDFRKFAVGLLFCAAVIPLHAQNKLATTGTLVIVPADGEVTHANDQARVIWMIEEQDKDKALAASRTNQKMKQGMEIIRKADPDAQLKTYGYYTYPVYPEEQPRPLTKARVPSGWRVGQYLEVKTTNLQGLPKTVSSVQRLLALSNLQFGLSDQTEKLLDARRIDAAYGNLTERIAAIAKAMGRSSNDAIIDTVDFEGSGAYAPQEAAMSKMNMRASVAQDAVQVEEPSFEPGETTLHLRVVGKVRFK